MTKKIETYEEFWPYYLREHSSSLCRRLHFAGTTAALVVLVLFLITNDLLLIPVIFVTGYGPAWIGHFFIEKNRPATFQYPVWSLVSDFRMYFLWLRGELSKELKIVNVI